MREGAMGDVIMLTPIIRQLYMQRRGNVSIDVVTAFGAVFDNNPYVHSIIPVGAAKRVVRTYDMVIDFNGLYERDLSEHPVRSYAKHAFGDDSFPKKLDIFYKDADVNFVKAKLKEFKVDGAYLVCHKPNHDWPNRNLPNKFWIDFLKKLSKSTGKKIIQVGSSSDFALRNESNIYDQRGLYDLQKLAALINMSSGFVGVDAGPSHIAASTNAPIFTFYTCAHHEARMPLRDSGVFIPIAPNVECYGCMQRVSYPRPGYFCETGDNKCVEAFSATNAVELISDAISNPC
jgi:ADP-heptose:LPS heptosyltransferase